MSSPLRLDGARNCTGGQPVGRMGRPGEVAHMALYPCSAEAEFATGSAVTIDRGWTAM